MQFEARPLRCLHQPGPAAMSADKGGNNRQSDPCSARIATRREEWHKHTVAIALRDTLSIVAY